MSSEEAREISRSPRGGRTAAFAGKRVLVTGGSSGIGRAIALAFARAGAVVVVADIKPWEDVEASPGSVKHVQCDVALPEEVKAACDFALGPGELDVLVNNVAYQVEAPCHLMELEDWERTLKVNLTSYFLFSKYSIPSLLRTRGAIVNIASVHGHASQKDVPGYAASKGGVLSFTRQLSMQYCDQGLRVNSVSPGTIQTPLVEAVLLKRGTSPKEAGAAYPMGRIGQPSEISDVVLFLSSPQSTFITGQDFVVDGGIMSQGGWCKVA